MVLILGILTVLTVTVVVAVLKNHSGNYSTGTQRRYVCNETSNRLSNLV